MIIITIIINYYCYVVPWNWMVVLRA